MALHSDATLEEQPALERAPAGTPLYLHLPFCVAKCTYCDFFSVAAEGQDLEGTLETLIAEIRQRAPREPRTVFLGGGTPSLYSVEQLTLLFGALQQATGFRESALEVTLEANPESLDRAKAAALLDLGVDRLSIGIQSLRPDLLERFGRVHDVEDSFRAFEAARSAGFRRLNVDLIYAAPGQVLSEWKQDLRRVLDLAPDHVSAYNLAFEEGTAFTRWLEQGVLEPLSEELELEFFLRTREWLGQRGYEAYEVSNYSLSGQECRHNLNYWHNEPYVGVGPSAASLVAGVRSSNPRSISAWRQQVRLGRSAREGLERLSPSARLGETWWLGLRLSQGVDPEKARATAGFESAIDPALALARELAQEGWLESHGGRWRLTAKGLPLADALSARFLESSPGVP